MKKFFLLIQLIVPFVIFAENYSFLDDNNFMHEKLSFVRNEDIVTQELGNVFVAFRREPKSFITSSGDERYILEDVFFYAQKDEEITFLGYIKDNIVFGSDDEEIKGINESSDLFHQIVGVSSIIFQSSGICFVREVNDRFYETDSFMMYEIDIEGKTIRLFDPFMSMK